MPAQPELLKAVRVGDGGDAEEVIAKFAKAGIDYDKLGMDLQREAAESFASNSAAVKAAE